MSKGHRIEKRLFLLSFHEVQDNNIIYTMNDTDNVKTNIAFAFDRISRSYDRTNRIISLGMDLKWRKRMVSLLPADRPLRMLDIACGTCDSAIAAVQTCGNIESLVGLDASEGMLAMGMEKVNLNGIENIELIKGDMLSLPFEDDTFDCVSIVFGLRNAPDTAKAIKEAARVLKAGGKCLFLEFSMPENVFFRSLYYLYLRFVMPVLAFIVSGKYSAYKYLFKSVNEFYRPKEVLSMMESENLESNVISLAVGAVWVI